MYGSVMRGRVKSGRRAEYERLVREIAPVHQAEGLQSIDVAWEDKDPDRVVVVIRFRDKESYLRNAQRPETDRDYRRQLELLEGEPEWIDITYAVHAGRPVAEGASSGS
ncbi:MAG: hypothetical protein E6J14_05095 [Chloroflexi bacterium]|nr:MAG: hypothetical protein E6J14_05095 [Chloroflexota bacterium]